MELIKVETIFNEYNANVNGWNQKFNQVAFINLDPSNSVWVNKVEIVSGQQLVISLNLGEYNVSLYDFDFRGSTTARMRVIYTRYTQQPQV